MKLDKISNSLEHIEKKKEGPENKSNIIQYLKVGKIKRNQGEGVSYTAFACHIDDAGEKNQENKVPWEPNEKSISGIKG